VCSSDLKRAKQSASQLAFGNEVTVQMHCYDKYTRTIADMILPDGTNVNHALVKDGWCMMVTRDGRVAQKWEFK
jgi:endonuclease YncB( thermonuclease family)